MDDGVVLNRHAVVEDVLPDDVAIVGGERADNVQKLLNVDRLQLSEVSSNVPLPHELQDLWVALPEIKLLSRNTDWISYQHLKSTSSPPRCRYFSGKT